LLRSQRTRYPRGCRLSEFRLQIDLKRQQVIPFGR
jgi:hypothetical protein